MAKAVKVKRSKTAFKKVTLVKSAGKTAKKGKQKVVPVLQAKKEKVIPAQGAVANPKLAEASLNGKKPLSKKFVETLEKHKNEPKNEKAPIPVKVPTAMTSRPFGQPMRRRGRRPKGYVEYQPQNNEEDSYVMESEQENLEYDTGIRFDSGRDDGSSSGDRQDYDEELNFDW